MNILCNHALLEAGFRFPAKLYPEECDVNIFVFLRDKKVNINSFVKTGGNLFIYSENSGTGKTEWSKKLLLSYLDSIWREADIDECRALFVSVPQLVADMKDNIRAENPRFTYIKNNIIKADLVVWDDIAYKAVSSFEHDFFLNALQQRAHEGKANIFTATGNKSLFEPRLGSRLTSMVINNSETVRIKGSDQRGRDY